jgi:Nif-specific ferredoxin III
MTEYQALRRDGTPWDPMFIDEINAETCIGCGRCYKVCNHNVLAMMGMTEDDELVPYDDDEVERVIMTIADKGRCVGCESCLLVCGSHSIKMIPAAVAFAA